MKNIEKQREWLKIFRKITNNIYKNYKNLRNQYMSEKLYLNWKNSEKKKKIWTKIK